MGPFHPRPIKEILDIPQDIEVVMVIPVGYPRGEGSFSEVYGRKSLKEITCYDRWESP